MSLKTSDLGQFLTVKISVGKFFGSDHSVALFEVLKNPFFRFSKKKLNVHLFFQCLLMVAFIYFLYLHDPQIHIQNFC
jgi:hypothetical protein